MRTAYKVRAYPNPEQAGVLNRTFGCVRVVWNRILAARQTLYAMEHKSMSYKDTDAALTAIKKTPEFQWLNEVSSVPLQQTLRHQHAAFAGFFAKRARFPRFKSRNAKQSATFTRSAFRWRDGELTLAKTATPLRIVWSWPDLDPATLNPSTVTVSRDPAGRWFVTLQADVLEPAPLPITGETAGVDLGLTDFLVLSTGERIPHPRHMDRHEKGLKHYQRVLARKQRGSANRAKAKAKVARKHAKVADARRDFLHKTSTDLVRRFDGIAIEDLAVKNMVKLRTLAKSISRTGWGEFREFLTYKAEHYGRTLVVVDRWYPSSKTCSDCGHLLASLSLGTRHWICPGCGARHDRDINAAKNIRLAAGLAASACGGDVRQQGSALLQPPVKQEHLIAKSGIPVLQVRE